MKRSTWLAVTVIQALVLALAFAMTSYAADETATGTGSPSVEADKAPAPEAATPAPEAAAKAASKDMVLRGDAKCTRCHDEDNKVPVLPIGKTRHGVMADKRTPTCTSCHGDSDAHTKRVENEKDRPKPDRSYTRHSTTPIQDRNQSCLECHQGGKRIHWSMSAHAARDVACTSCHDIHTRDDAVRSKTTQSEVCFTCHKEQRAQINRPSRHPIREGKVACSDCHNPHGSAGEKLLVRDNVNDTCYQCHMEKRGPFVRTHQPVQEDCSICHNPHGTTNPNLLKVRPPFLCQSCHEPTSHHSTVPVDGMVGGVNPSTAQAVIMARGCVNCHTNIHGSNNAADGSGRGFRR
jgi:DmsE family decaheme c-type cytochrome